MGFVSREPDSPPDQFLLTRFVVSCCVADALSVRVRVVGAPPGRLQENQWVRVDGRIYPLQHEVLVAATSVTPVARPDDPYLSP